MFMLQFFTGATNVSAHSTLQRAQRAFLEYAEQYHTDFLSGGNWVRVHKGYWRLETISTEGEITDISILELELDAPITPV